MEWCKSELFTDSSSDKKYFGIKSFHPSYPDKHCLIMRVPRNININGGRSRNSSIRYTGEKGGESLIELISSGADWGAVIKYLGIHAGNKLDYCLKGVDVWYSQTLFEGGCYENAVLDGIQLSAYMTTMTRVFSNNNGRHSFSFGGPASNGGLASGSSTSISLNNCWSRRPGVSGFKVHNELWYSSWQSCGNDGAPDARTPLAYDFNNVKGVVLSGMGAEQTKKFMRIKSFRGLIINGIQLSRMGNKSPNPKLDYCIELVSGFDAVISGFSPVTSFSDKYDYDLYVSGATGNESVTILDHSIRSNRVGYKKSVLKGAFLYPDIFQWAVGRSQDSGFSRAGNTLFPSSGFSVNASFTGIQGTVVERQISIGKIGPGSLILYATPNSTHWNIIVDITMIRKTAPKSAVTRQFVVSKENNSIDLMGTIGEAQSDWTFNVPTGNGVITVLDAAENVEREFIVKVRFTSSDNSPIIFAV